MTVVGDQFDHSVVHTVFSLVNDNTKSIVLISNIQYIYMLRILNYVQYDLLSCRTTETN